MHSSIEHRDNIAQPLQEGSIAYATPSALLDQAANLAIRFTAAPRDYLGPATDAMKMRAALGEKIAAAIRALCVSPPPATQAPQPMIAPTPAADTTLPVAADMRAARIESALAHLLASDPITSACSEDDLSAAVNDAKAPPFVREQAAAMLAARAALEAFPGKAQEPENMDTEQSREYLVRFMEAHFQDRTYHRYIRGQLGSVNLAGDFAWQMARALQSISAPLEPATMTDGAMVKAAQALLDEHKAACLTDSMDALNEMAKNNEEALVSAALLAELFRTISAAPAAQGDAKDSERLRWMAETGSRVVWGADYEYCYVRLPAERDGTESIPAEGYPLKCYDSWHRAIDAAIAAKAAA